LLIVPSVAARMERNVLINDGHPEVRQVTRGLHQPIWWDKRLFSVAVAARRRAKP
jgi:RES domain-containing protein